MNSLSFISLTLGIIGGGGIVGLISILINIGTYKQKLSDLESKLEDYEKQNRIRFNELYNSRNNSNERIAKLEAYREVK